MLFYVSKLYLLHAVHFFLVMQYDQAPSSHFFTTIEAFPEIYAGSRTDSLGKTPNTVCVMCAQSTSQLSLAQPDVAALKLQQNNYSSAKIHLALPTSKTPKSTGTWLERMI